METGVLVDLDGDGSLDLAVRGFNLNARERRLYLLRGLGGGAFARASTVAYPIGQILFELWAVDREILFTVAERDQPTRLYRVTAGDGLETPRVEKALEGQWILRWVGDVDGDGLFDLVISTREMVQVLVGDGHGGFREGPQFVPLAGEVRGVRLADLDGDGFLDLVVKTPTGVVTALRRGEGSRKRSSVTSRSLCSTTPWPTLRATGSLIFSCSDPRGFSSTTSFPATAEEGSGSRWRSSSSWMGRSWNRAWLTSTATASQTSCSPRLGAASSGST